MTLVKLKMKIIYKSFLSIIGLLLVACLALGLLYLFTDKSFFIDSDIEVNGQLSINYDNSKNFNIETTDTISFTITNSGDTAVSYNINFIKVRGAGTYTLKNNDKVVSEGKLYSSDEISSNDILLMAGESIEYILIITNSNKELLSGKIDVKPHNEKVQTFASVILNNNPPVESPLTQVGNDVSLANEGLITSSDDNGVSYYFRGKVDNNYVSFGNLIWRIVRINGDGTVRLVLDGGTETISSYYTVENSNYDFEKSNMNSFLESWLQDHLSEYTNYIANTKFCSDIGHDEMYNYNAYARIITNQIPTLNCLGNVFSNSIGLLTIDEVVLAGASPKSFNRDYYLYNDKITDSWYTMTGATGNASKISLFMIDSSGNIKTDIDGNLNRMVRPVINLVKNIKMEGDGTITNPYKMAE